MYFLKFLLCYLFAMVVFGQSSTSLDDEDDTSNDVTISADGIAIAASRKICNTFNWASGIKIRGGGCHRFVRGFDMTGVANESNQGEMASECDCLAACIASSNTCAAWVWKYTSSSQSVRSCLLYSNFNLPLSVSLAYDQAASVNQGTIANNPQSGEYIQRCTMDGSSSGAHDKGCYSGVVWEIKNNRYFC